MMLYLKRISVLVMLIIIACHPEHRRDTAPDNPGRSKHSAGFPKDDWQSTATRTDSVVNDSTQHIQRDSTKYIKSSK